MKSSARVVVAMSGGVDSSVAAALLKEQGYDVVGVTMRLWDEAPSCASEPSGRGCCGLQAIDDARRVAARLEIPHYVYDLRREFERHVIANFCAEYAQGRTPNPCIRCNQFLKFDILLRKARALEADLLATGHYARIWGHDPNRRDSGSCPQIRPEPDLLSDSGSCPPIRHLLLRPRDQAKDQTYFLYAMTQEQLAHTLFPLGDLTKPEVRELARRFGLVTAEKRDSQEICFAPKGTYPGFLRQRMPELGRPGPILDSSGREIGKHPGIVFYTIGQRRRIGIARPDPLYVTAIDPEHNSITVGPAHEVRRVGFRVRDLNLISIPRFDLALRAEVQIRYQHKACPATLTPCGSHEVDVELDSPQWAVTPGQAAVFYDGDVVIGGGTIG